ncbi:DUF4301 family protein [Flavobacteriaceae bacterium 3-367]|uniref:DUF4301 family protein n=1 Tax=Eudoraea algarum TaxID=3417568 RepID=UPI003271CF4E
MNNLSEYDLGQLVKKGVPERKVLDQIETFKEGIPFVDLEKAATVSDGILKFSEEEEKQLIAEYDKQGKTRSLLKFVPASGAASRMFKALFHFLKTYDFEKEGFDAYLERTKDLEVKGFFDGLEKFPFYREVQARIANKALSEDHGKFLFVREMLLEDGLNFGDHPKGLLPFHDYGDYRVTPFEEHLKEAALYARTDQGAKLHFTISEQHSALFKLQFESIRERVVAAMGAEFDISYSFQKSSTDTIAVTLENEPFRNPDGSLLFRPGGHGALIENLNEQDADIIFIKNIDNVVVPQFANAMADSKKVLGGLLLRIQSRAFEYAKMLDLRDITAEELQGAKRFLEEELNARFSERFSSFSIAEQIEVLKDKINRPIRVCGMVKNEGEPGGGPFWTKDRSDHVSLQIIESAQVDMSNAEQVDIFKNSTHFNPVDLVCGIKSYEGKKYNLLNFVDFKQGFITQKTKEGKNLKALELPGLWNGAMAHWNTIFVEVPLITFNPVKTVNDLLKPAHQVK